MPAKGGCHLRETRGSFLASICTPPCNTDNSAARKNISHNLQVVKLQTRNPWYHDPSSGAFPGQNNFIRGIPVKKSLIVMLAVIAFIGAPVFAADQDLIVGVWSEAHNLNDIGTPDDLEYVAMPYFGYAFGKPSADRLYGSASFGLVSPYVFGEDLDTVSPAVQGWFNYRLQNTPESLMETGLSVYGDHVADSGFRMEVDAKFDWYPYNRLKEVTVNRLFRDFWEGLRMGAGLNGGVFASGLFEDGGPDKEFYGSLSGLLESGLRLGETFWIQGEARLNALKLSMPASADSYEVSSAGSFDATAGLVSDKLVLLTGISGNFGVDKVLTKNGFFDGSSFDYSWMLLGEAGCFFADELYVYSGVELHSSKGSFAEYSALYIGAQYLLF